MGSQSGVSTCAHCSLRFKGRYYRGNLARHVRQQHSDIKAQGRIGTTCRFCKQVFQRHDARSKHEWKKHELEDAKPWSQAPGPHAGTYDRAPQEVMPKYVFRIDTVDAADVDKGVVVKEHDRPHEHGYPGLQEPSRRLSYTPGISDLKHYRPQFMSDTRHISKFRRRELRHDRSFDDLQRVVVTNEHVPPHETDNLLDDMSSSHRDHIFLIDDSSSMSAHWSRVHSVFSTLASITKHSDPDGISLDFSPHSSPVPEDSWACGACKMYNNMETAPIHCPVCLRTRDRGCTVPYESFWYTNYSREGLMKLTENPLYLEPMEGGFVLSDKTFSSHRHMRRITTCGRITKLNGTSHDRSKPHRGRTRDGCFLTSRTWSVCIVKVKDGNEERARSRRPHDAGPITLHSPSSVSSEDPSRTRVHDRLRFLHDIPCESFSGRERKG